jgi:hypothetical protein
MGTRGLEHLLMHGRGGEPMPQEDWDKIIQLNTPGGGSSTRNISGGTEGGMDASKISAKTRAILKRHFGFGEIDKRGNQL